jgi:hypothetical protein
MPARVDDRGYSIAPSSTAASASYSALGDPLEALEKMRHRGGEFGIHRIQRDACAKLLSDFGTYRLSLYEVVEKVLNATKVAVSNDSECNDWDWVREQYAILLSCVGWINKQAVAGADLSECLTEQLQEAWEIEVAQGKVPRLRLDGLKRKLVVEGVTKIAPPQPRYEPAAPGAPVTGRPLPVPGFASS